MCDRPEDPTVKNLGATDLKIPRWRTCVRKTGRSHGEELVCGRPEDPTVENVCATGLKIPW